MVQRKVINKHSIQSDRIEIENPLKNLKPSFFFKDMNNKGATDLKKKMKKSGSIKRIDFDTTNKKRHTKQPPNYMKSTTSSDSRKERSQSQSLVSTKSIQNTPPSKKVTNTSSLKLMRSLTKTNPSFKPARFSMKKCLCKNLDVQRATCSSTLKDYKLPNYLMLNPGGTELEGTSVFKVCHYTYCSLNGHFHAPSPPLKGFLSAKRRMIKNQRNIKIENQGDFNVSAISPMIQEEGGGFFFEIYGGKVEKDYSSMADLMEPDREGQFVEKESEGVNCNEIDSREEFDSEGSDVEWEKGCYSDEYLDDNFEILSKTEKGVDLTGGVDVSFTGICFDEFPTDGEAHEVFYEEGLSSDSLSRNDDCESFGSFEYPENLNDFKNPESGEETVICGDESLEIGVESHLSDEYQIMNDENRERECKPTENFESLSIVEHAKELNSEATEMNSDDSDQESMNLIEPAKELDSETIEMNSDDSNQESLNPIEPAKEQNSEAADINSDHSNQESLDDSSSSIELPKEPNSEDTDMEYSNDFNQELSSTKPPKEPKSEATEMNSNQELLNSSLISTKPSKPLNPEITDKDCTFNPREPNFLPLESDPDSEKVDLRHQEIDDKKNSEEWMVDYALRQTVNKLGLARKKKVALLVEAFEKVMPTKKYDQVRLGSNGSGFDHTRQMQACM